MERFDLDMLFMDLDPRYNISPSQTVPIIIEKDTDENKTARVLETSNWGLVPGFVKDPRLLKPMINARAETLLEKRMFKGAFLNRRCLIPADGFYEWLTENKKKQPVRFQINNGELFAFAGIYEEGKNKDGEFRRTCAIITVEANQKTAPVHHRMPAILKIEDEKRWIDNSINDPNALMEMLNPCDNAIIDYYRCSTVVNSARSDNKNCILPAGSPEALAAEQAQAEAQALAKANKGKAKSKAVSDDESVQLQLKI
jgi:putative SOS response-associated peptidase YedK